MQAIKNFGFNAVRLHQKVNSDRWYYQVRRFGFIRRLSAVRFRIHIRSLRPPLRTTPQADKLGVAVLQDFPQKCVLTPHGGGGGGQ